MSEENDYTSRHLSQLIGKKVKRVCLDSEREIFGLEFTDQTVAWILRDSEGNGPGFLAIDLETD